MPDAWLVWALVAVTVAHVLLLVATLHVRREVHGSDTASSQGDGNAVDCPDCGVANASEYRFCRNCVAELPGPGSPGSRGGGVAGRRTF